MLLTLMRVLYRVESHICAGTWNKTDANIVNDVIRDAARGTGTGTGSDVLLGLDIDVLQSIAKQLGHECYRGKQIYDALLHGSQSIDDFKQVGGACP
jgi:hypothetical protein